MKRKKLGKRGRRLCRAGCLLFLETFLIVAAAMESRAEEIFTEEEIMEVETEEEVTITEEAILIPELYLVTQQSEYTLDYRESYGQHLEIPLTLKNRNEDVTEWETVIYEITSSNEKVVSVDHDAEYSSENTATLPFTVCGVGKTELTIDASESEDYTFEPLTVTIEVTASAIRDEDYVFIYGKEGSYTYPEWCDYLEKHDNWLNQRVRIALTRTGAKYYNRIGYADKRAMEFVFEESTPITEYSLCLTQDGRGASTKELSEHSFQMGLDFEGPVLKEIKDNHACRWEKTSDEDTWYLAQDYEIEGCYEDALSGIRAVEYSTDGGRYWTMLEVQEGAFALTLENGTYTGIRIRGVDAAGNSSEEYRLMNEDGEDITVVIDDRVPETKIAVTGSQSWTNQPVSYQVKKETDAPQLYQIYYQYVPVWQRYEREQTNELPYCDEAWQELLAESIDIGADECINQNGTYYFKSISMCGLESEVVSKQIRLQQTFPILMQAQITNDLGESWYNAEAERPVMTFPYEDYLEGRVDEGEYQAPLTLHRVLTLSEGSEEQTLTIGFTDIEDYEAYLAGEHIDFSEKSKELTIDFTDMPDDTYEVSYWIEDAAGNCSETVTHPFRIDTTPPTNVNVALDGAPYESASPQRILYDTFSAEAIHASATAEDAVSGVASVQLLPAKRIGDWNGSFSEDSLDIKAGTRCFLYVVARDEAGNETTAWTNGIVVDNEAPVGANGAQFIVTPSGTNVNGFFNKDFNIALRLKDMPNADNAAGFATIRCEIVSDLTDETKTFYHSEEGALSEEQLRTSCSFEADEMIDAARFEGNDVKMIVTATDRAGNEATSEQFFQIDVTKPEVSLHFEGVAAEKGSYYSEPRIAYITVYERNFDAQGVTVEVTRNGKPYQMALGKWQTQGNEHQAQLHFTEDGDYTLSVTCTDLADNESEKVSAEPFTIDCTAPELEVAYEGAAAFREGYYAGAREAVLTVTEHNFDADNLEIVTAQPYTMSAWTHTGDVYRTRIRFATQGEYQWSCHVEDRAGNLSGELVSQAFTIDTEAPYVKITGVADNSANAGDIFPEVIVQDVHFDGQDVQFLLENGDGECYSVTPQVQAEAGGCRYILPLINEQPDNVYYLTVIARDLAGNETGLTYRFSLNRNGSAYDMSRARAATAAGYYNHAQLSDIVLMEMNVDKVEKFSLYVTRNGVLLPSREVVGRQQAGTDAACYQVSCEGNERSGYTYTYTLCRESFAEEGTYQIGFYSKDAAGNEVNNTLASKDAALRFTVDNTPPKAVFDGLESGGTYNAKEKQVNVRFSDNGQLSEAYLCLVDEQGSVLEQWDYLALASEAGLALTIPEYEGAQSLTCRAVDAAGNELSMESDCIKLPSNFVITTNTWVRLQRNNKAVPLAGGVTAAAGITALGGYLFIRKRRRNHAGTGQCD